MVEYIDREAFEVKLFQKKMATSDYWINDVKAYRGAKAYREIETDVDNFLRGYNEAVADALAILDSIIAADVVEVVRCKDCDSWCEEMKTGRASLGNETAPCSVWSNEDGCTVYTTPTDFCSYGERKENAR